jgi:DNA replication protein DnaC
MTAKTTTPLADQLNALGLRHTATNLDDLVAIATKRRFGATETIELLVEREAQHRAKRSLERRLARSRIGRFKPVADYEWDWPKRIDRDAVEAALRLEFLDGGRNIVLVAP